MTRRIPPKPSPRTSRRLTPGSRNWTGRPNEPEAAATDGGCIVDAYDDPSIANGLAVFDQQVGLPAAGFTKIGINSAGTASTTRFPTADSGWAGEIELDVEWTHAIAPGAKILLVEANSSSLTD